MRVKSSPPAGASATHAALLFVQFAFASQAVEAKVAMLARAAGGEEIAPEAVAMVRMLGGTVFFQLLALFRRPRGPKGQSRVALSRSDHAKLFGLSLLGISANQTLFLYGLKWTTPFAVSLLGATIPIFAATLAVLFRKEAASWKTFAGLSLALSGVLYLTGIGSIDLGAILVALNSLSYAAYVVLSRDVVLRIGAFQTTKWVFTYGALAFLPIGLPVAFHDIPQWSTRGFLFMTYIVAVPTIAAYLFNAWALGRSSATMVTAYIPLQPLIAAILAWIQLGQGVTPRALVSAVLILSGLAIVVLRDRITMSTWRTKGG